MHRFRLLASGTILAVALTMVAQQATTNGADKNEHSRDREQAHVPAVEQHLKLLTEKLDLTGDQQAKVRPIVQEMHDTTVKAIHDESISSDQRSAYVRTARLKADKDLREVLNDEQKKKLDQLEQEPHSGLHGKVNGTSSTPAREPLN